MRLSPLFIAAAALAASSAAAIPILNRHSSTPLEVFVNCLTGSDETGDGLRDNSLRSPMAARDMLRRMQPLGRPAVVEVSGDCFPVGLNFSQAVLELESQDSGSPGAVITYRASEAGARFLGGYQVPFSAWEDAGEGLVALDLGHLRDKVLRSYFFLAKTCSGCKVDLVTSVWGGRSAGSWRTTTRAGGRWGRASRVRWNSSLMARPSPWLASPTGRCWVQGSGCRV